MAELNRTWVAAVFAADAKLNVGASLSAKFNRQFYEFADAVLVKSLERVALEYFITVVRWQELNRVVAGESERHLSQIVSSEAEELRFGRDFVR
jgi:hypothetical protein